jgi:hypothetical protein
MKVGWRMSPDIFPIPPLDTQVITLDRTRVFQPPQPDDRTQAITPRPIPKPAEVVPSRALVVFASVIAPKLNWTSYPLPKGEFVGSSPTGATPLANGPVSFTDRPLTEFYHARLPVSNNAFSSRFAHHFSAHRQPQAATSIASDPNESEVSHVG